MYSELECTGVMVEATPVGGVCYPDGDGGSSKFTITDCAGDEYGDWITFVWLVIIAIVLGTCIGVGLCVYCCCIKPKQDSSSG
eukprot:SAG31_NODE_2693_length_5236_cov_23.769905_3_plen_83_part_00